MQNTGKEVKMNKKAIAILLTLGMFTTMLTGAYNKQTSSNPESAVSIAAAEEVTTTPTGEPTGEPAEEPTGEPASGSAITIDKPAAPTVTQIKGGDMRVKLYWKKVNGASGYYIYFSTAQDGTFSRTKTITDPNELKYVKTSLLQGTTYYFKISSYVIAPDGSWVEGDTSPVYSADTVAVSETSTTAKKYETTAKFKKSPAYKNFKFLQKAVYKKSFAIPGQKTTNVAGFENKRMFPQAACAAGAYMLVSAYAYNGEDESVIYVLSRPSKTYITTLVMPNKTKLNAIAYDGKNIWVTQGKKIAYFSYEVISKAVAAGTSYTELAAFDGTYPIATTGSYMAYRDNMLWIGAYNSTQATKMYGYELGSNTEGKPTVTQKYFMSMPNRTRAISFDDEGYMYITRSRRTNSSQSGYLSKMQVCQPNFSAPNANGGVKKGSYVKKVKLPPMAMGSMVYGQYVYTVFAGARYTKCTYKVDRVIAYKRSLLR